MLTSEVVSHVQEQGQCIFNRALFEERVQQHDTIAVAQFKQITRHFALFHISFFSIACLELVAFVLFFSFLTKSTLLAFSLAAILLTGFSYFVLLFYLQAKKPQQLLQVRHAYLSAVKRCFP